MTTKELSQDAKEWLEIITDCDGAEVPKEWWEEVEELVRAGLVDFGSARGPCRRWRRAVLKGHEMT
jgi:hypothetical protein